MDAGTLLRPEDYPPPTEAAAPAAAAYRAEALRLGAGVEGHDYRYGDDLYQRIALFVPKRPNGTILAYMHGGGWVSGFKEVVAFMAPPLLEAGIVFASMGYRLAPAHLFPAGADDAMNGVRWLYQHAREFGGQRERLFLGGFSSGGHYAALLAVRKDWQASRGLPQDVVRGCVPVSGVYDLTSSGGLTQRPRFLGPEESGNDLAASPIYQMQGKPPPFFMAHGDNDFPHLMKQAQVMEAALRKAGGEVERIVFAGRNHFTSSLATADPSMPWRRRAVEWLLAH
jgi:arylformamidase